MKLIEQIPVNIDINDLVCNISRDDAKSLIEAIDLRFAEVDFTLDTLKILVKSLESDLTREEIAKELGF